MGKPISNKKQLSTAISFSAGIFVKKRVTLFGTSAIASIVLAACGSSSSSVSSKAITVPTGKSYFVGKTITFIAPDAPGAQDDTIMRAAAAGMGKYLGCSVKVTNVPQGNTMPGQDEAASAKPNGLTIGYLNVASDLDAKAESKPGISFNLDNVEFLGSPPAPFNVMVSSPTSSYKTIQDVLDSTTPVKVLEPASGGATSTVKVFISAYNANMQLVTGYANSSALVQGFLRGDGPVTDTAEKPLLSAIASGNAIPILQMGSPDDNPASRVYNQLKNVPTLKQLISATPPKLPAGKDLLQALINYRSIPQQWLFVPAGTPSNVVATLQAAMKAAFTSKSTETKLAAEGLATGYISGSQGLADVKLMQAAVPKVLASLKK
jgi:tripartite-type tricarboxylate transporter receptor subunit TctC